MHARLNGPLVGATHYEHPVTDPIKHKSCRFEHGLAQG
jgi:hypothetical protein